MYSPISLVLLCLASTFASAQTISPAPNPGDVKILSAKYAGSGCPGGSARFEPGASPSLTFSNLVAKSGPGIPLADARSSCQLIVAIKYPAGYQFSLSTFNATGFGWLSAGNTGTFKVIYFFSGDQHQVSAATYSDNGIYITGSNKKIIVGFLPRGLCRTA